MESQNNQSQYRFLIAAVLSMVVLFGWSYFFSPPKPATDNANTAANTNSTPVAAQTSPTPAAAQQPVQPAPDIASLTPDTTPNRTITIRSPLYEVKLDSRGAVATSWILLKNKSPKEERPVYADGSNDANKKPLQLISDEALRRNPRQVPFRLATDDANVN